MVQTIELPHVGESVVEGTIGKWLKQPGDKLKRFEPLVEVVTDKVTMELPSPVEGSLLRILAQEGETVPMGAPIAEVETADGAPDRPTDSVAGASRATAAPAPAAERPATKAPDSALDPVKSKEPSQSPGRIGYLNQDAKPVGPTGGGAGSEAPWESKESPAETPATGASAPAASNGVRLSPAVRRLARERSVDLSQVQGTGMGGRITRDDVLKFIESEAPPATAAVTATTVATPVLEPAVAAPSAASPRQSPPSAGPAVAGADEEHLPLTPVRRMIAEAMVRSVSQIPHAWSTVEVDVNGLVGLRGRIRSEFERREGVDLTYLPFVIKAVVESLKENPTLNATWGEDKIILKKRMNIGLAMAAPSGLMVPVIHDADRLSLVGLAHAVSELTGRARQNKLTLEDVHGGTFTLNNTGVLGSTVSQPIINYPQAAIMTTEAIQKRPVVINDAIAIRSMMNLCLSFDHRINDGAEASAFLQAVKRRLEDIGPDTSVY